MKIQKIYLFILFFFGGGGGGGSGRGGGSGLGGGVQGRCEKRSEAFIKNKKNCGGRRFGRGGFSLGGQGGCE